MRPVNRSLIGAGGAAVMAALLLAACGGSTVVITGENGSAVASVGPSGQVSISSSDGGIAVGTGKLPDGWPSAVGQPAGFAVMAAATTSVNGKPAYTASMQADGDQTAAVTTWLDSLKAAGYTQSEALGSSTAVGGISILTSPENTITVIRTVSENKTGLVVSIKPT